ncbi:MAG: SF1B family DNA helicase RecD2, partial [Ktedonobacterales bacterium]
GKVCVLTGGPGVGKTTTIRALLDVLDAHGVEYALAAPTGRAAKRMAEATGRPAKTLHRLLEFLPSANDFAYNERRPLPARFVVVDEVSMLDILLAYRLVKALAPETHLLLVGDADQLPSVGPGSVFADIIASEAVPVVRLTELFRQASQSAIIVTAHGVNRGEMPALQPDPTGDFFFLRAEDPQMAQRLVADLVARRLPSRYGFDPIADIQVLAPMYRGPAGVIALNAALQTRLNAQAPASVSFGEHTLRVGDKVMQVRNNYDKGPAGVFNGDVGRIVDIAPETNVVSVHFPDEFGGCTVAYEPHELDELTLAYACSIHRAQGSEYPCVVLPLVTQHYLLLQRNLLYTALTRARRLCVVVGDVRALRRAVENDALAARNT